MTLVREELGEEAELLERDSAALGRTRAARGLLRGGLDPDDVAAAVRAHRRARRPRPQPAPDVRLARARRRARGGRARRSCTCTTTGSSARSGRASTRRGEDCTRCQGRDTRPGVRLDCRGGSRVEALTYARGARRAVSAAGRRSADAIVVPSAVARGAACARSRAPLDGASTSSARRRARSPSARAAGRRRRTRSWRRGWRRRRASRSRSRPARDRRGSPLVVAGDGPQSRCARGTGARFVGRVDRRRARARCAPGPRWRSCRRAAPRPSASPPPRRWRPGCRSSRRASARWPSSSIPTGSCRPATPDALAERDAARASATRTPGRPRARARCAHRLSPEAVAPRAAPGCLRGGRNNLTRHACARHRRRRLHRLATSSTPCSRAATRSSSSTTSPPAASEPRRRARRAARDAASRPTSATAARACAEFATARARDRLPPRRADRRSHVGRRPGARRAHQRRGHDQRARGGTRADVARVVNT